jgi:p-cumate 2,3-dioxygenase beta subunit
MDTYVGHSKYKFTAVNGELKILEKRVILDLDSLRPQGKVSIIL